LGEPPHRMPSAQMIRYVPSYHPTAERVNRFTFIRRDDQENPVISS